MSNLKYYTDGNVLYASDLNTALGQILKQVSTHAEGGTSSDLTYDLFTGSSGVSMGTTGSSTYSFGGGTGSITLAHGFDEFNITTNPAGSLDTTNKWTSTGPGSVYLESGRLIVSAYDAMSGITSSSARTKTGVLGFNPKTFGSDCYVEFRTTTPSYDDSSYQHSASATIQVGTQTLRTESGTISGGGGPVVLGSMGGTWQLFFKASGSVYVYKDGFLSGGSAVNIGAQSDWTLNFAMTAGNTSSHSGWGWAIYPIRYVMANGSQMKLVTTTTTLTNNKDMATLDVTTGGSTMSNWVSNELSLSNGSTFTVMGSNNLFQSLPTGSKLVMRTIFNAPTSIPVNTGSIFFPFVGDYTAWHFTQN